jgi:hypothetical protein
MASCRRDQRTNACIATTYLANVIHIVTAATRLSLIGLCDARPTALPQPPSKAPHDIAAPRPSVAVLHLSMSLNTTGRTAATKEPTTVTITSTGSRALRNSTPPTRPRHLRTHRRNCRASTRRHHLRLRTRPPTIFRTRDHPTAPRALATTLRKTTAGAPAAPTTAPQGTAAVELLRCCTT